MLEDETGSKLLPTMQGAQTEEEANKSDCDGHVRIRKGNTKERKIAKIQSALSRKMERGTRVRRKGRKLGDHRTIH